MKSIPGVAVVLLFCVPSLSAEQSWFERVGLPGAAYSTAASDLTNDGGMLVGTIASPDGVYRSVFRWTRAGGIVISPPPADLSVEAISGISGDGGVCAITLANPFLPGRVPYLLRGSNEYIELSAGTRAMEEYTGGISMDGRYVAINAVTLGVADPSFRCEVGGECQTISPLTGTAYPWANAVSADGSVIVGGGFPPFPLRLFWPGFIWTQSAGTESFGLLAGGAGYSIAMNVSSDGRFVVGVAGSPNNTNGNDGEAVRWCRDSDGGLVALGDLPGGRFHSAATDVSDDGRVVVGTSNTALGSEAFVWTAAQGMRRLSDVLFDLGLQGSIEGLRLSSVASISGDGRTLAGNAINEQGRVEAWIAWLGPVWQCRTDINADGLLNSQDFFDYIIAFFTACEPAPPAGCPADFNRDGVVNTADFFEFLAAFLAGCE